MQRNKTRTKRFPFQTTVKKTECDTSSKKTAQESKTIDQKKKNPTITKKNAPKKPPKGVSFDRKSCRRSLCFSDEEEGIVETTDERQKRDVAKLAEGFYKE